MTVRQLIYTSQPFGFDATTLDAILLASRRNNRRDGITGALIVRHDVYLQLLEGSPEAITAAFARIACDDRHSDLVVRVDEPVAERMFPQWDMRDDPARSWLWTPSEVAAGALDGATAADLRTVFARVAADAGDAPASCPAGAKA